LLKVIDLDYTENHYWDNIKLSLMVREYSGGLTMLPWR